MQYFRWNIALTEARAPGNAENTKIREIEEPEMKLYNTWSRFNQPVVKKSAWTINFLDFWRKSYFGLGSKPKKKKNPAHAENKLLASENSESDR